MYQHHCALHSTKGGLLFYAEAAAAVAVGGRPKTTPRLDRILGVGIPFILLLASEDRGIATISTAHWDCYSPIRSRRATAESVVLAALSTERNRPSLFERIRSKEQTQQLLLLVIVRLTSSYGAKPNDTHPPQHVDLHSVKPR